MTAHSAAEVRRALQSARTYNKIWEDKMEPMERSGAREPGSDDLNKEITGDQDFIGDAVQPVRSERELLGAEESAALEAEPLEDPEDDAEVLLPEEEQL